MDKPRPGILRKTVSICNNINLRINTSLQQFIIQRFIKVLCFSLFLGISVVGCNSNKDTASKERPNNVVIFFKNAEIQAETDEQRQEIKLVLLDMLNLTADELRIRKYPDYQNNSNQWDVIKFANSYFVPASPQVLAADTFFEDLEKPEARAVIQQLINSITIYPASDTDSTLNKK